METKKTVAEEFGNPTYRFAPVVVTRDSDCAVDCYSASNFNQLCQDFDRLNEKYLALKKACEEAVPVAVIRRGFTGGCFLEFSNGADMLDYAGAKVFTHPTPVIASEQKPVAWKPLSDVQWMNIVNHDHAWINNDKESAINEVVKLVEANCKENNPSPPSTADIEQRVAEAIANMADDKDVERTDYCMHVYEEGEQYKSDLIADIKASKWRGYL